MSDAKLTPIKTFGKLTIYSRAGRTPTDRGGLTKYVVFNDATGKALEDFGRYARAARWAKAQPEGAGARKKPHRKATQ